MPRKLHAVLDAWAAVRDLGEVAQAEGLLVGEAEGAVIGRNDLQGVVGDGLPERSLVALFAQRR